MAITTSLRIMQREFTAKEVTVTKVNPEIQKQAAKLGPGMDQADR